MIEIASEGERRSNTKSDLILLVSAQVSGRYRIGPDTPLRLDDYEWPESDLFVIPRSLRASEARGPDTLLVIAVADTSRTEDLGRTAALYAKYGVREYWVIDLVDLCIHVHRRGPDGTYGAPQVLGQYDLAVAALAPEVQIRLADIL